MARPIESTPILSGEDAQKLYQEAQKPIRPTPQKTEELNRCFSLYERFLNRLNK